ncbi:MAG: hypothetical protein GY795_44840 [Desulfobacterales bacterium]|nr:hypothetical protein [Desulfobacterales bacterium]
MTENEVLHQTKSVSPERITMEMVTDALHRIHPDYLHNVLQYIEFLEYKCTYTPDDLSENKAFWDAVQADLYVSKEKKKGTQYE